MIIYVQGVSSSLFRSVVLQVIAYAPNPCHSLGRQANQVVAKPQNKRTVPVHGCWEPFLNRWQYKSTVAHRMSTPLQTTCGNWTRRQSVEL
jgi:hypothetical protein